MVKNKIHSDSLESIKSGINYDNLKKFSFGLVIEKKIADDKNTSQYREEEVDFFENIWLSTIKELSIPITETLDPKINFLKDNIESLLISKIVVKKIKNANPDYIESYRSNLENGIRDGLKLIEKRNEQIVYPAKNQIFCGALLCDLVQVYQISPCQTKKYIEKLCNTPDFNEKFNAIKDVQRDFTQQKTDYETAFKSILNIFNIDSYHLSFTQI